MSEAQAIKFLSESKIALTSTELKKGGFPNSVIGRLDNDETSRKMRKLKEIYHLKYLPSGCNPNSKLFAVREEQYKNWIIEKVFNSNYSTIPLSLRMMLKKDNYVQPTEYPRL
ncbi:MAG: hypothetical protein V1678_03375 [Candidatus Aenigmatarchaeota archaeon]